MAKLPSVVSNLAPDLRAFINRVREAIDGKGGNKLVSVDDLISGGIAEPGPGGTIIAPGTRVVGPPPAPTNVSATGSVYSIFVEWDDPRYFGHAYAEIWGGETDNIGTAVLLGMAPGVNYVDSVPPSSSRYYWVRFVNILDEAGPYNAVSGTLGETAPDVEYLLDVLTGQITETQLYNELGERIDLIDGPISLAGSVAARIYAEEQARLAADTALGSSITTLQNTTSTQATQITSLQTRATTSESNIINLQTTTASQATSITSLTTRTGTAESNITNLQTTTATQATQISTLSTTVNGNTAAISVEATTRANADNSLFAQYTVKIDNNGYVSGFGLASTANNATPFSEFAIRADRFYVASPSGPGITPIIPFIVNTTEQTVNGVTVPPGVYMDAAFVKNGTITNAKIGNAAIDDAKIVSLSAAKITAGDISVGNYIQSTGYIAGSQGWKIHGNGFAEFGAASIRGTLTAAQINSNGLSIRDTAGNIILNAGTGVFSGTTSSSNVTGLGALATQNTVSGTTQVTGLGGFAYLSSITSANISTYIAGAAIGTAYISDAAITNALIANGAITSAKIGDAQITNAKIQDGEITSAKIGTAAITSAKIGTAEVDTIKIAGNAVTVPVSAFTAGDIRQTAINTWQTVQSISITTSGSRVFVATAGTAISTADEGGSSTPIFRIARDGSELMRGGREAIALSYSDTPAAGTYTYQLQMLSFDYFATGNGPIANNRSIFVIETKR